MNRTIKNIGEILEQYSEQYPHLECDGMMRVCHYLLDQNNIEHTCHFGQVLSDGELVIVHYWIESGKWRIDYRCRMWCGIRAPHGVFLKSDKRAVYSGKIVQMDVPTFLFDLLTQKPMEKVSESA